jgi:hypothetical protein
VIELLEHPSVNVASPPLDERAARRTLLGQIERLERELAELFSAAWPRQGLDWGVDGRRRAPRLLDLGELEQIRDSLANRIGSVRAQLRARKQVEDANRRLIEEMLRDPASHRWVRVSHADIGEPGCRHWHVVPRLGLIGMLAGWWHVKVSSGCPLPEPAGGRHDSRDDKISAWAGVVASAPR